MRLDNKAMSLNDMYNGLRVVAVLQNKGGVGKTFLSSNLAVRASIGDIPEIKKRTLMLDIDPQQNLSTTFLKMETLPGRASKLPPVHPDFDPDGEVVEGFQGRSSSLGLYYGHDVLPYECEELIKTDILPADGNLLANLHVALQQSTDRELIEALNMRMREFFSSEDVQDIYDLVIIDCPPGKGLIHHPILHAVTDIVIPCVPATHSLDGVTQTINLINEINAERRAPPASIVGVFPNKYDMRSGDFRDHLSAMRSNSLWGHLVPDFELKELKDYRINHLPGDIEKMKRFRSNAAEVGMSEFIEHFRARVYGARSERLGEAV